MAAYGWLTDYRDELARWEHEHRLVQTTIAVVRIEGLHAGTAARVDQAWGPIGSCVSTERLAARLRAYIATYRPPGPDERFVASTEILESSFGKLKRIERQQSHDGLTGLVLVLGALVGPGDDRDLRAALDATPQKRVETWIDRVLGRSMQWLRRQFFATNQA